MEILKNINLYNLVKLLVITLSIILIPLMALRKILEKIKINVKYLLKAFNI